MEYSVSNSFIGSTDSVAESVSIAVVTAVATQRNVSPIELPPLYDWVDPDALDALFEPTQTGGQRRGRIEFSYDGHDVVVECGDELTVTIDGSSTATPLSAPGIESTDSSQPGV